jgi:hypothetical protein
MWSQPFTLEKVDFYSFFGANNAPFPFQFAAAESMGQE